MMASIEGFTCTEFSNHGGVAMRESTLIFHDCFQSVEDPWAAAIHRTANDIASHDTIGRVVPLIKSTQFQRYFLNWIATWLLEILDESQGELIPIDEKTLHGPHN